MRQLISYRLKLILLLTLPLWVFVACMVKGQDYDYDYYNINTSAKAWWNGTVSTVNSKIDTVFDEIGNNNAVQTDTAKAPSLVDGVWEFDGVDDRLIAQSNPNLSVFSFSAWFKRLPGGNNFQAIVGGNSAAERIALNEKKLLVEFDNVEEQTADIIDYNKWYHLVVTYDNDSVIAYLNCDRVLSFQLSDYMFMGEATMYIGELRESITWPWNGSLDELLLFDYVLTTDDMQNLYNQCDTTGGLNCTDQDKITHRDVDALEWQTTETGTFTGTIKFTGEYVFVDWGDGHTDYIHESADDNLTHDYDGLAGDKDIYVEFSDGYESVTEIDIANTNSKGDLSSWPISDLVNLEYLYINDNNFEGDLSTWDISNLTSLIRFYINDNNFEGDLSSWDISNLTSLQYFLIHVNNFEGDLSSRPISDLTSLQYFYIYNNNFEGAFSLSSAEGMAGVNFLIYNNTDISAAEISTLFVELDAYAGTGGEIYVSGCNNGNMTYSDLTQDGKDAHDNMVNNESWTIIFD